MIKETLNDWSIQEKKLEYQNTTVGKREILDKYIETPEQTKLGNLVVREDIESFIGPFFALPEYKTRYPSVVIEALSNLYAEYNRAFTPLVYANQEWDTDYQYSIGADGTPINYFVQIDMVGLSNRYLEAVSNLSESQVREDLRGRIFEIENSLAMYQLLERLFPNNEQVSNFDRQFRASLDGLRKLLGRPIALLAVTDQKYQAMKESEFGKRDEDLLTDDQVKRLSGFDRFFGPSNFLEYLAQNGNRCDYLLYVRSSDPVSKLINPELIIQNPLLSDPEIRRIIKANAITFNIDAPGMEVSRRINDTKGYMQKMGMAQEIHNPQSLYSKEFIDHLKSQGVDIDNLFSKAPSKFDTRMASNVFVRFPPAELLSDDLKQYLLSRGINPNLVASGEIKGRFKPMLGSYGCYGHFREPLNRLKTVNELKINLKQRGPYVFQPEMKIPTISDQSSGSTYTYIDRNFFSTDGRNYRFMGGFRSLMPVHSQEAKMGRNHGSNSTVWAEIF